MGILRDARKPDVMKNNMLESYHIFLVPEQLFSFAKPLYRNILLVSPATLFFNRTCSAGDVSLKSLVLSFVTALVPLSSAGTASSVAGSNSWMVCYTGPGSGLDSPASLVVDGDGNIYLTGKMSMP